MQNHTPETETPMIHPHAASSTAARAVVAATDWLRRRGRLVAPTLPLTCLVAPSAIFSAFGCDWPPELQTPPCATRHRPLWNLYQKHNNLTLATEPFEVFGANLGCVFKNLYHFFLKKYKYLSQRGIAACAWAGQWLTKFLKYTWAHLATLASLRASIGRRLCML